MLNKRAAGFGLIELMLASALSLLVIAAAGQAVVAGLAAHSDHLKMAHLQQELQAIAQVISRDLRRAGSGSHQHAEFAKIILGRSGESSRIEFGPGLNSSTAPALPLNCIEFAYDFDADGHLDLSAPNERYGYRLSRDGAVAVRQAGARCDSAHGWQKLSDERSITVTTLHFKPQINTLSLDATGATVSRRVLQLELNAHVKRTPSISATLQLAIPIRNDLFRPPA